MTLATLMAARPESAMPSSMESSNDAAVKLDEVAGRLFAVSQAKVAFKSTEDCHRPCDRRSRLNFHTRFKLPIEFR
jgi:hypothetical protein